MADRECDAREIIFRVHAVQGMFERGISADEVAAVLESGKVIESYATRKPYPASLILGWWARGHVVVAVNESSGAKIVITVYEPDPDVWEPGFERRKK